jgi:hypothetical protein
LTSGKCSDYHFLAQLPALEELHLNLIRNLDELSFLKETSQLKFLELYELKGISKLPEFSSDSVLEGLSLEKLMIS